MPGHRYVTMGFRTIAGFVLLPLSMIGPAAGSVTLHVNPNGNDAFSGLLEAPNADRTDGPKASLAGAQAAVRALKAKGPLTEVVRVRIAPGLYFLTEPLIFTPADSGTTAFPVIYEAASDKRPVFSGGKTIKGFKAAGRLLWQTHIPEVAAGKWYFEQLFVNGHRAVRARDPNLVLDPRADVRTSYHKIEENLKRSFHVMKSVSENEAGGGKFTQEFLAEAGALDRLAGLSPAQTKDVTVVVYHNWDTTRRFVGSLDAGQQRVSVTGNRWAPWNPWRAGSIFHFENARPALDAGEEWFLDRDGTLFYMSTPGGDLSRWPVVAPMLDTLVVIKGEPESKKLVESIQFNGLSFQHSQWLTPPGGVDPVQAAANLDAAIMVDDARKIRFSNCEIAHVGRFGIWFRHGCRDIHLEHCLLHDLGAGGVRIGETKDAQSAGDTGGIIIDNNIIKSGGRIFPQAVAVLVGQSGDNVISHNEISDHYYTGISTGWTWGYGKNLAKNNRIEKNHIHHLGQGVLSDLGGFYSLGPSEGTRIVGNVVHDIYSTAYGGWGLYTDEGSTGVTLRDNLVYNTKTGGFHQHYGKENLITNNIFAYSLQWQMQLSRAEPHRSFTFSNNIVYWSQGGFFGGVFDRANVRMEKNLYWDATGKSINFTALGLDWMAKDVDSTTAALAGVRRTDLARWQSQGRDAGSLTTDPLFENPEHYDFRLKAGSPANQIGFVPFDYSQAGVYGDPAWLKQAAVSP
jgi:hypothetical protein